jgi:hypothetical protein
MEEMLPALMRKVTVEEQACSAKIKQIEDQWESSRPRTSEFSPKEAIDQLTILGQQITKTNEEWQRVCKAQELLDMELGDADRL